MYMYIVNHRHLRRSFKEDIVRDLLTSTTAQAELEAEWQQLKEDRDALRTVFPTGNSKVRWRLDRHLRPFFFF